MATERVIDANIKTALINNDDFEYAHLIKFERPFSPDSSTGNFRTNAERYAYLTDASRDILFDDGNSEETYRANKVLGLGNYQETTTARATSMNLTLAAQTLGTSIGVSGTLSGSGNSGSFAASDPALDILDFYEEGLREGDKIKFVYIISSTQYNLEYLITGFSNSNKTLALKRTGTDTDDDDFLTGTIGTGAVSSGTLSLESEEITGALIERGTSVANPHFLNREVFIYKVFIEPETGGLIGTGSSPTPVKGILTFKGLISGVDLKEGLEKSEVKWTLTSHWGDFTQASGRFTTDESHRALDSFSNSNSAQTIRPEYAADLGFLHGESSVSAIANYTATETKYRQKKKRRGGLAGFFGGKYTIMEEYQEDVQKTVDLNIYINGKSIPVVYGVQRIEGIPFFADCLANSAKDVYIAHAICEGEIHGIFNMYIDDKALICTDKNDSDVRAASLNPPNNETGLRCYGRADRGQTTSGEIIEAAKSLSENEQQIAKYQAMIDGSSKSAEQHGIEMLALALAQSAEYEETLDATLTAGDAQGFQHGETFKITYPFNMNWNFFAGRANQLASNQLVTIAEKTDLNRFMRQSKYYEGNLPFWGSNHRALDTAYAVSHFRIGEAETTVPEVEYVVKGKILECYNYDNSYVHDRFYSKYENNSSVGDDLHTNFNEGDTVKIETKASISASWAPPAGNPDYKIIDKWLFTTNRSIQFYRFRIEKASDGSDPDLGFPTPNDGVPSKIFIRLKKDVSGTDKYWHMITYNHFFTSDDWPDISATPTAGKLITNGNRELTATFTSGEKAKLDFYGTDNPYFQFEMSTWSDANRNLEYAVLRGEWGGSGNLVLTFPGTDWGANGTEYTNLKVKTATIFNLTGTDVADVTDSEEFFSTFEETQKNDADEEVTVNVKATGAYLEIVETGERREITGLDSSNNRITVESPFFTAPQYGVHTFRIAGRGADLRASNNPAMQLLDYISSPRYGKDLDVNSDCDLNSFLNTAQLCDTRSDITVTLDAAASMTAGAVYTMTDDGAANGDHVASGVVKANTSSSTEVTFTGVIGKFVRQWNNYAKFSYGDVVYNSSNNFYRYMSETDGFSDSEPTHDEGTANSFLFLATMTDNNPITLHKTSGSGPSSVNLVKTGKALSYSLYDSDFVKYWRYYGWEEPRQREVTRHQTNFILDTAKSVFSNLNVILSHFNGILAYENGKNVLGVETQEAAPTISVVNGENTNPYYIENTDIIGDIKLKDNTQRNAKNQIKSSISDPQNNWGSRSVTFYNSDFVKADRGIIKSGSYPTTGITNYYSARIGVEKELYASRFNKDLSFTLGPRGMLLRCGEVISLTYAPFGYSSKLFRIENLNFLPNCNVSVKAREYDDSIYEISVQQAAIVSGEPFNIEGINTPGTPSNLRVEGTLRGSVKLLWENSTTFDPVTDHTEIWMSADGARTEDDFKLVGTAFQGQTVWVQTEAESFSNEFWIRHVRITNTGVSDG